MITGQEISRQLDGVNVMFGKNVESEVREKRAQSTDADTQQWRKKSIFSNFHIGWIIYHVTILI